MSSWSYQAAPELSDEQYARWQSLLEARTGICFLQHKSILQKGLYQRMQEVGADDYEQYFQKVSLVPAGVVEWIQLVDRISVKETSFFREPNSFDVVKQYLSKRLVELARRLDHTLDIWSVGCSTGEEAYSLAIEAREAIDGLAMNTFAGVMATDISQSALAVARKGNYERRKLAAMPLALRHKYFVQSSHKDYQVTQALKQSVCFSQGNILNLDQMPKLSMDIIFCQNVLIYFRRDRQKKVLDGLVQHLKPGGMLMIGPGEVIGWRHPQMQRTTDDSVQAYIRRDVSN